MLENHEIRCALWIRSAARGVQPSDFDARSVR